MATFDLQLYQRLQQAARMAAAVSAGLLDQVMQAQRHEIHCRGQLSEAELRLQAYQHGDRPSATEDPQDWSQRQAALEQARAEEFASLQRAARDMPPGVGQQAVEQLSALQRPAPESFLAAVQAASARLRVAEQEVAALIAQQGRAGARAGRLRQTCTEARDFLRQHHPELLAEAA